MSSSSATNAYPLVAGRRHRLGRAANCDVQLVNRAVSKEHAAITWNPIASAFELLALGKNGTAVNGEPLAVGATRALHDGDQIELASICALLFSTGRRAGEAQLRSDPESVGDSTFTFHPAPALVRAILDGGGPTLELDLDGATAYVVTATGARQRLPLQRAEFEVLRVLLVHCGRVVNRGDLQERTSDRDLSERLSDSVYRHVSQLRKKLGPFAHCIRPIHGSGYLFEGARLLPGSR